jgi:hypothetical protein
MTSAPASGGRAGTTTAPEYTRVYLVGPYRILVWDRNLLPELG